MRTVEFRKLMIRIALAVTVSLLSLVLNCPVLSQTRARASQRQLPTQVLIQIIKAEDTRKWDDALRRLLSDRNAKVRSRAALAAGRIGDEAAIESLATALDDYDREVAQMAAFALGEIESPKATPHLLKALREPNKGMLRARELEALGKIAAALPKEQEAQTREIGAAILDVLQHEQRGRSAPHIPTVLLGVTAVLRAKPEGAGPVVADFLLYRLHPAVRADAANTLARLRLKDGNDQLRKLLTTDPDPVVRANAARVLGVTEDKDAFDGLLDRALNDRDSRVRVSAIRALATVKDARATTPLLERGNALVKAVASRTPDFPDVAPGHPTEANEALEIATTLGRLRQASEDARVVTWLRSLRPITGRAAPEVDIAMARVHPASYVSQFEGGPLVKRKAQETILLNWRAASSLAQGLGEIANVPDTNRENKRIRSEAEDLLRAMLDYRNSGIVINTLVAVHSEYAVPDVLRAFAAFKSKDLDDVLRKHFNDSDVVIRGTAAELLGELPPSDTNTRVLIDALAPALRDKELNDAALAILDALGKQKSSKANEAIKSALDSRDHLIRRRAVSLLKTNGAGDFSARIGPVQTQYTNADYIRAVSRIGKQVTATIKTTKGPFVVALLPEDAPLNVDNFIQLARRGYFRGIMVHRVVPNFVIQDGDPRGDGNGGPGYQIRCEINQVTYERGVVGMALSGKDTGGSQWFVTHSRQPHLDGGYTVFGTVLTGMNVVDDIIRGDIIQDVLIAEQSAPVRRGR